MGNRSNINIIIEETEAGFVGINLYNHWGGKEAQKDALKELISGVASSRLDDPAYFTNIIAGRFLKGTGIDADGLGGGITPFVEKDHEKALAFANDWDHPNVCFDFTEGVICQVDEKGEILLEEPFTALNAKNFLGWMD